MSATLDDAGVAVLADLDPHDIDPAGCPATRRPNQVVRQVLSNVRGATMREIPGSKCRQLRTSLDLEGTCCFRGKHAIGSKELRIRGAAIGGRVHGVRGLRDQLLDLDVIARAEGARWSTADRWHTAGRAR